MNVFAVLRYFSLRIVIQHGISVCKSLWLFLIWFILGLQQKCRIFMKFLINADLLVMTPKASYSFLSNLKTQIRCSLHSKSKARPQTFGPIFLSWNSAKKFLLNNSSTCQDTRLKISDFLLYMDLVLINFSSTLQGLKMLMAWRTCGMKSHHMYWAGQCWEI